MAHAPPIAEAGWWLPGKNGTGCFAFTRQDTEVCWLPEQMSAPAYEKFVAEFNQERHVEFERRKAKAVPSVPNDRP
jgi:hypothetical protein